MGDEMVGLGESGEPGESSSLGAPVEDIKKAISAEINWRGRALEAEGKLSELERALADLRSTLEQTRDALDANERRRQIEIAVAGAGAIDVETVTMLIDAAMKSRPPEELGAVIEQIQRQKPFLFEGRTAAVKTAEVSSGGDGLAALAEQARASGDRRALLRYLQARRGNQ